MTWCAVLPWQRTACLTGPTSSLASPSEHHLRGITISTTSYLINIMIIDHAHPRVLINILIMVSTVMMMISSLVMISRVIGNAPSCDHVTCLGPPIWRSTLLELGRKGRSRSWEQQWKHQMGFKLFLHILSLFHWFFLSPVYPATMKSPNGVLLFFTFCHFVTGGFLTCGSRSLWALHCLYQLGRSCDTNIIVFILWILYAICLNL